MKSVSSTHPQAAGWRWLALVTLLLCLLGGPIAYLATTPHASSSDGRVRVVAAENFYGDIAARIGGARVQVTSILNDPTADPHLYESNAGDAAALASAQIVISNGLGYDDFMDKLLAASPNLDRQDITAASVVSAPANANPHLWYQLDDMRAVANAVATALSTADPAGHGDYQRGLQQFDDSLAPVDDTLATIRHKDVGTKVAYTERVPGYMLDAAGLPVVTPPGFAQAMENGSDPAPADTQALDALITSRQVRALLYNAQATSPASQQARARAQAVGLPVVPVTETLPAGQSFAGWQLKQAQALLMALGD